MSLKLLEKLKAELSSITTDGFEWNGDNLLDVKIPCGDKFATIMDGKLFIHNDNGTDFCDYYGEHRGGYPWIHPALEKWAKEKRFYWEWRDPGAAYVVMD